MDEATVNDELVFERRSDGLWDGPPTGSAEAGQADAPLPFRDLLSRATPRFVVTPMMLALNAIVFVAMVSAGVSAIAPLPDDLLSWGASFGPHVFAGEWWRIITSTFVHIGLIHLVLNMQALWRLGALSERLYGNWSFLLIYLVSGIGGAVASLWANSDIISAGASGAIFGVAGALAVFLVRGSLPVPPRSPAPAAPHRRPCAFARTTSTGSSSWSES